MSLNMDDSSVRWDCGSGVGRQGYFAGHERTIGRIKS